VKLVVSKPTVPRRDLLRRITPWLFFVQNFETFHMANAKLQQQFAELFDVSEAEYTGVMLALYPPDDVAAQVVAMAGVTMPAEQLHVTVAYCGSADMLRDEQIAGAILTAKMLSLGEEPLNAKLNGIGRFNASDSSDGKDVIIAIVDCPGLDKLRNKACKMLEYHDCEPSDDHGYTPHMTLAYVDAGSESPLTMMPTIDLTFDRISVAVGGKVAHFPFVEVEEEMGRMNQGLPMPGQYSEVADLCADGQPWRLFNEVAFAEPPTWINYLPKPGEYAHEAYGKIAITPERNRQFVQNFKAAVYQEKLPIDAEHQTKMSGAVGWITDMKMNEDGSADAKVDWTDRGRKLIESDRFKYFSPEWYGTWTDPATEQKYADVAIGGAITTRPFWKEQSLRPLVASERGIDAPTVEASNAPVIETVTSKTGVKKMAEDTKVAEQPHVTVQQFGELQAQFAELNSRYAAAEEARTEAQNRAQKFQEALDKANERVATLESAAQVKRFGEVVTGWYGKPEDNVAMLVTLAQAFGEGSAQFNTFITQQKAVAEQLKSSNLFSEIGTNKQAEEPKNAAQKFSAAVSAVMNDRKVDYVTASGIVAAEQPQLYVEHVQEQRGK
jgi:2'-5' RNA ligase